MVRPNDEIADHDRLLDRLTARPASAMFDYVEVFHNRRRRHSSIGMLTPIDYEKIHHTKTA